MSLDVLLLSNADDFASALPTLESLTQTIRNVPLSDQLDGHHDSADVAITLLTLMNLNDSLDRPRPWTGG